jgi:hypothetical protein
MPYKQRSQFLETFSIPQIWSFWRESEFFNIESTVRDREELLSVSMTVATADEIKLLFLEFQSAGVAFHQTLKKHGCQTEVC